MRGRRIHRDTLIWFGRNDSLKSRFSSKVYSIAVYGRTLVRRFGPANIKNRRIETRWLQTQRKTFYSHQAARQALEAVVQSKLNNGYERAPKGLPIILSRPKKAR